MQFDRAVITGAAGMLGTALLDRQPESLTVTGVDLVDGDLGDLAQAEAVLTPHEPQVVIHCAAYADVDGCSRDPEKAFHDNALATENVAKVCARLGARLLILGTDYVFDGTKRTPYTETDPPHPLNPYGESKLAAEQRAFRALADLLVVRTQWLYGPAGRNFVAAVVQRAKDQGELRVVADQWGSPTYTRDLAPALWQAALAPARGIIHLTGSGSCSWADLAEEAVRAAGLENIKLERISAADWPTPTIRPSYSVLDNRRWLRLGFAPLRPWQEAVGEYAREYLG
jgi:dTDP-4-dehydrorhamnose reductase